MKALKRIGSFLLALVMVLSMIPATHTHAAEVTSGYCGDPNTNGGKDVSWTFQDGVLTISGTGKTNEYGYMGEMYGVPYGHDHLSTPWTETAVTSLVVEEGVTHILGLLSWGAYNLTDVSLPDSLKVIGHCSFEDCDSLTSITIPKNVTSIWSGAFWACENLTSITFTGDAPSINDYAFNNAVTATCYYPASANWPADKLKSYGGNLTWVAYDVCADGHSFGTDDVCTGCGILGGSCGSDLIWTLDDAGKLTITGTGYMENYNYGSSPFYKYADKITSVSLPDGLNSIGERAFDATFPNLEYIEIPTSVSLIRDCAFGATYNNVKLKYAGTMEQWNKITIVEFTSYGKQYGAECSDGTIIYKGPCGGSNGLYSTVQYALLGDGTLKITGSGAMTFYRYLNYESCFSHDPKILRVEISEGVTNIAGYAFKNCTNLTEVHIPASVTSISYNVFQDCTKLTDVYYGSNEKNWNKMSISSDSNEPLAAATIHYTDLCTGGHTWTPANCTAPKTCSVCDATEGESLGHTWVDANCTAPKACVTCFITEGEPDPNAHSFVNGTCEYCQIVGGYCGDPYVNGGKDVIWSLVDGVLTISGSGDMDNYDSHATAFGTPKLSPWFSESNNIQAAIVEEGVTRLGDYAFYRCWQMYYAVLPASITHIGERPFSDCNKLWHTLYAGTYQQWSEIGKESVIDSPNHYSVTGSEITEASDELNVCLDEALYVCNTCTHVLYDCMPAFMPGHSWTSANCATPKTCSRCGATEGTIGDHSYDKDHICTVCGQIGGQCGENVYWILEDGVLTIYGTGTMYNYDYNDVAPWYGQRNDITAVEIGDGVTTIGDHAFSDCEQMASVEIADSVTGIGRMAFYRCHKLTAVTLPVGLRSIGSNAFNMSEITAITIPEGITKIEYGVFKDCYYMTSVVIPSSVTTIDTNAFQGCANLTKVVYCGTESSWEGIYIFAGNNNLKDIARSYHDYPEADCTELRTCNICGETEIVDHTWADADCVNPKTCKVCGETEGEALGHDWVDADCVNPKTCKVCGEIEGEALGHDWNPATCMEPKRCGICGTTQGDPLPHEWQDADCNNPETCSTCGGTRGEPLGHSWQDASCTTPKTCSVCDATEGEAIPTAHTWVEANCTYAKTCDLCGETEGEAIPNAHVFEDSVCKHCGLQGGTCGESAYWTLKDGLLTVYGSGDMTSAPWPKEDITTAIIEEGITSICEGAFEDCEKMTAVSIPNTVTTLGNRCFDSCKSLASVDLPEGITTIPSSAFAYCWALTGIQIPESVTSIGYKAFAYCREMVGMQIPEKVTSIGGDAFTGCSKLAFVHFSGNGPEIGSNAFYMLNTTAFYPGYNTTWQNVAGKVYGANKLTWVAYDQNHLEHSFDSNGICSCGCIGGTSGQNAQWALDPVTGTMTISGTGKMEDYASASQTPWTAYKDIVRKVVVEEGITHVGGCAFKEFSNLEEISLPDSLKSIGSEAIMLCKKLTKIEIPSGVTQIGVYAFEQCYALESVVLPNGLSAINAGLFNNCTGLKAVTIPASVTTIGTSAFSGCNSLTDVYYGSNEKAWGNVTIGSYNTPLLNATIHYTDPCLQGHNEVGGVCANCGIGLNLQDYQYTLDEAAATVTLTDYIGSGTDVHVAASYLLDGKEYSTLLEATSVFRGNTAITSVAIDDGVTTASNSMAEMFYGCASLKTADLTGLDTAGVTSLRRLFSECKKLVSVDVTGWDTSKVEDMSYLFDYCSALTTITGYENWNTGSVWNINKAFNRTTSIHKVDLSKWDLSKITNSGWCFQICYAEEILLPDNLAVMSAGFFNHPAKFAGSTFTIPSGVKKIGYAHTIYDFGTDAFAEFIVPETNSNYQAVDGILYSKDGTELIAVPRGKTFENGIFEVPNTVTFMGELSFSRNYNIETLVLPDEFIIEYVPLYDSRYILEDGHGGNDTGNLNSGTNLSIAIYCYTGITAYDVRDTNTHYEAVDGVIYSEDMTTMVAVPARYAQHLNIPEGVTSWNKEALWADHAGNSNLLSLLENCTGVSIPSTLTEIDAEQLSMINNLADRTSSAFTITVAEGNRTFHVDPATGHLATHSYSQVVTDPTCEDEGYTTHTCAACGDSYETDPVPAKDHDWTAATCIAPKTCTECGETEGEAASDAHSFADGACSVCGILGGQCGDEAYWILSDGKLTVYGSGNMYDYQGVQVPWGSRRAIITQVEVMGGVTSVGDYAFNSCTGLTVVTLADSVVEVGQDAFAFCSNLQMLDLGNGLESFDYYAFRNCTSLKELTIPGSIRNCGESAFQNCTALESVTFDDGAAAVGMYMFQDCTALKSVTLPDSITYLADAAFRNCGSLESITIPAGVKDIGIYAFENCTSLKNVQLREGLERIGGYTFYGCEKLQDVQLPASIKRIDESAFAFCAAMTTLELPQGLSSIGFNAFDRSGLTSITVPGTVIQLYGGTFYGCENLAVAVLEEGVTTLYSGVFRSCTDLHTLVLPKTITQIGDGVLEDTNVTDLYYGSSQDAFAPLLSKISAQFIHYNCTQPEGHWSEVTKPGNCTQGSYTCDGCPCGYEQNIRNVQTAPGHDWADADCETAKTCKVCGTTEGDPLGHDWQSATCTEPKRCGICGTTRGDPLPHEWKAADCNNPETCGTCGGTRGEPLGHSWVDADCTAPKTCDRCGETEGEALGHAYKNGVCSRCDAVHSNLAGYSGKTISILGDSISTFRGVSNDPNASTTIQNNATYYNGSVLGVGLADTWWQQTVDALDLELLVNNSWSGSCIYTTRAGTPGAYVDRCVQLHNNAGTVPDVIAIYLGTNDYCNFKSTLGSAGAINYAQLIQETADGYTYAEPTTAMEAYAIMLHKMTQRYPLAEIYCFTLLPMRNLSAANQLLLEQFNGGIKELADHFNVNVVDLYTDSGIQVDDHFQDYIADNSVHPGPLGMDVITDVFVDALLDQGAPASHTHFFESVVTPSTCTGEGYTTYTCAACGGSYVTNLVPAQGHAWIDATCYSLKTCNNCGITQGSMLEHEWQAADCTTPKHCKNCTATEGEALGHDWQDADCENPKTCRRCSKTEGTTAGHSWIGPTCYAPKTCSVCGAIDSVSWGHNWLAATCIAPETCTSCGITRGEKFPHTLVVDPAVDATCTATGKTEGQHCSACNTVIVAQQTVPAKQHIWQNATCDAPKTCNLCGKTQGEALGHDWQAADCTNPKHCKNCSATEGEALGHTWLAADCDTPKACSVCGVTEGTATGHTWKNATCVAPKICDLCGKTQGDAKGHDWQAADCTNPKHCKNCSATEGETLGHTWLAADCDTPKTCSVCGVTEGTATGHTWKNATCVAPKTCDLCGKTQGDAKGHDWSPATCTENATCKQCGKVSYGTKLPHTEVTDPAVNATCTTTGKTEGSHCSVCGTVTKAQQTIPALDHMEVIDKAVEATCTATGKTEGSHCSVCGKILKAQDKIPAMGHTPVADAPVAPTCAKAGLTEGAHCVVCGAVLKAQQVVSTIAHTYDSGVDGTCNVCGVHRENVETRKVVHMFRMYNPNTGEHFYTGSEVERDNLIAVGWQYEGIGFTFPANTGLPVYRLFQPSTGEHLYTMDEAEKNTLMAEGWNYEGIAFNSAYDTEAVQHRLHNPNATVGAYHFTFSEEEKQNLINAGWEYQGIGWYSCWK